MIINIDYEIMIMSEIGDDVMSTDIKWIICYYSPVTHRLLTLKYEYLESALKMINKLLDTYGYDLDYKMFKGDEWL